MFQTGEGGGGVEIYMKHYSSSHDEETYEPRGGGALPFLKMVGNFHILTPIFDIFQSHLVLFYAQLYLMDPLFLQKKICCLSHI